MAKITPETAILNAIRNQSLSYKAILGELIDNAFDAGASRIRIEVAGKDLIVEDDGNGCSDLASMVTLGKHIKQSGTRLGRYGVGLKDAALWLGGPTRIRSVNGGRVRTVFVDWDHLVDWEIPDPIEIEAEPGERGTRLTFHNISHRFPDGDRFREMVSDLSYLFTPALKNDRQIVFRGRDKQVVVAKRFELPPLERVIDRDISIDGKRAHIHVGVVPDGIQNVRPGIAYTHGFRVIMPQTALGCGGHSPSRISGWVSLDGGWRLNKNKDGVNAGDEELGEAVYAQIKDIVADAAKQAMSIKSAELAQKITSMLRGLSPVDARREPGDRVGSVSPKGSGRKHQRANKSRDGASRRGPSLGRMNIDFRSCSQPCTGEVDFHGGFIYLAENNSWIAGLRKTENVEALVTAAVGLFAAEDPSVQPALPAKWAKQAEAMSYGQRAGLLLQEQAKPDLKVVA
jgi:hypothetical protein